MTRPRKTYYFTRQESGQIVYKFIGDDGRWHARRVPMSIVAMLDAVEWIRVTLYSDVKVDAPAPNDDRIARLRALADGTDNPHEAAAARRALERLAP